MSKSNGNQVAVADSNSQGKQVSTGRENPHLRKSVDAARVAELAGVDPKRVDPNMNFNTGIEGAVCMAVYHRTRYVMQNFIFSEQPSIGEIVDLLLESEPDQSGAEMNELRNRLSDLFVTYSTKGASRVTLPLDPQDPTNKNSQAKFAKFCEAVVARTTDVLSPAEKARYKGPKFTAVCIGRGQRPGDVAAQAAKGPVFDGGTAQPAGAPQTN